MMKLIANLRELDHKVVSQGHLSAEMLMENAGAQVALAVRAEVRPEQAGVLVCGPGNNGGDGLVCARHLWEAGFRLLTVVYTGAAYQNEALHHFERLPETDALLRVNAHVQPDVAHQQIAQAVFVVDALFGSGLNRPLQPDSVEGRLVTAINAHCKAWVLAIDLPSGVNGETGQVPGVAVRANATVTLAMCKPGLYLHPGKSHAGQITVAPIGIPAQLLAEEPGDIALITPDMAAQWLPPRPADAHKYQFGQLLVIAGSEPMPGAAVLCAEAAMSAGVGLVRLAAPGPVFSALPLMPEIMRLPLSEAPHLGAAGVDRIWQALQTGKYHGVLLGPGLGRTPETLSVISSLLDFLKTLDVPVVVDADALHALAQTSQPLNPRFILTPHAGECATLLQTEAGAVTADRLQAARDLQSRYGAQIVLKSASTVLATQSGEGQAVQCWIAPTGNPGMATAGSGDVLAGVIAALAAQMRAQEVPVWQAAPLGVMLHGLAGDIAAENLTEYAMRASDITRHLPDSFKRLLAHKIIR